MGFMFSKLKISPQGRDEKTQIVTSSFHADQRGGIFRQVTRIKGLSTWELCSEN